VICRTVEEVRAAAALDAQDDDPLDQNTADIVAAHLAPYQQQGDVA